VDLWGRATRKGGVRGERNGKWRDGIGKREGKGRGRMGRGKFHPL